MLSSPVAKMIDGYLTDSEAKWLAEQASCHSSILEFGAFLGKSTVVLAKNTSGIVTTVDDFYGPRDDGINDKINISRDLIYSKFLENTRELNNLEVLKIDHRAFVLDKYYDMVFIDGSHIYEDLIRDISHFLNLTGILICGHDIQFDSVKNAVELLLPKYQVALGTSIWYQKQ